MLARNNNFKIGMELCCSLYLYGSQTRKVMPITLQTDSMNEKYAGFIFKGTKHWKVYRAVYSRRDTVRRVNITFY